MYHGDIALDATIDIKFTTRRFTTGAPFTLAGSPAVVAYVGNGTTEITSGITLSTDFDSVTGLNNVRVVASSGNGFGAATEVQLVLTSGTVDGVSVVGEVIGSFSIENRSAHQTGDSFARIGENGAQLVDIPAPTPEQIAGAVWNELLGTYTGVDDSFGQFLSILAGSHLDSLYGDIGAVDGRVSIIKDVTDLLAAMIDEVTAGPRFTDHALSLLPDMVTGKLAPNAYAALVEGSEWLETTSLRATFSFEDGVLVVKAPDGTTTQFTKTPETDAGAEPVIGLS